MLCQEPTEGTRLCWSPPGDGLCLCGGGLGSMGDTELRVNKRRGGENGSAAGSRAHRKVESMPIEQVRCENCGSGDVRQLAPDSYTCEHCHTSFRWVDPTKRTVAHKPSVCACGRAAEAFFVRCGQGLCRDHGALPTEPSRGRLSREQEDYYLLAYDEQLRSSEYAECMEKHRIPEDREAVVCTKCAGECCRALNAVSQLSLALSALRGQVCWECSSDHVQGRCVICGVVVCSDHGTACETCRQLVCKQHVGNGRVCTKCGAPQQQEKSSQASTLLDTLWKCLGLPR